MRDRDRDGQASEWTNCSIRASVRIDLGKRDQIIECGNPRFRLDLMSKMRREPNVVNNLPTKNCCAL